MLVFSGVLRPFWRAVFYDKTITPPHNGDRSTKFYTVQCANKTVREANPQANTQGTPVPFNRLRGVSKVAAGVVCNVEASGKAASQRRNGN